MEWLAGLLTAGLAGLVKILLEWLYEKIETEVRAALKENNLQASDAEVAEMVASKMREKMGFDVTGKTKEQVDAESEKVFDDYFDQLSRR